VSGLTFDATVHRYTLDDVVVPSVTQILKASGLIDFSGIPESILEAARVRGTTVHQAIHFLNEGDLDFDQFRADFPAYVGYVEAWLSFVSQRNFLPVLNEHRIASRRHQIAGTFDTIGLLDGHCALVDYATGRPEDVSKDLQTAGYLGLALEWAEEPDADPRLRQVLQQCPVIKRYAVALRKDGTFQFCPYSDPTDFRKFLTLVEAQHIVRTRHVDRREVTA